MTQITLTQLNAKVNDLSATIMLKTLSDETLKTLVLNKLAFVSNQDPNILNEEFFQNLENTVHSLEESLRDSILNHFSYRAFFPVDWQHKSV